MQAYEKTGELERQTDQIVPLQSKLELAINERDAAIAKAEGLTPRPGVRAFAGVSPEGCKKLDAALAAHRFVYNPLYLVAPFTGSSFTHHDICMASYVLADTVCVQQVYMVIEETQYMFSHAHVLFTFYPVWAYALYYME